MILPVDDDDRNAKPFAFLHEILRELFGDASRRHENPGFERLVTC